MPSKRPTSLRKFVAMMKGPQILQYYQRVKAMFGSALIGYWPLDETTGTTAYDVSGNGRNGSMTAPVLANYSGLGAKNRLGFNGTTSWVNLFSASLATAFNEAEGSFSFWFKLPDDDAWSDATVRYAFYMAGTNNFSIAILKAAARYLSFSIYQNNTEHTHVHNFQSGGSGWKHYVFTWSVAANEVKLYRSGRLLLTTTATACTGALTAFRVGEQAGMIWNGGMGSVMLFNRPITAAEAAFLSTETHIYRMSILGDSICQDVVNNYWPSQVIRTWKDGQSQVIGHAVSGGGIVAGSGAQLLDAQVVATASDDADAIIIALGTSDDNAGNMTTLQAEVEENIAELKISNPNATIYWMNVLPRWTNNTTGPEVPKGNIRTAIAAACTAQGITCWDTYTDPWITQEQTVDGIHPTEAGHAAIAAQILARL